MTWEDIKLIAEIGNSLLCEHSKLELDTMSGEEFYGEVLRRYNQQKGIAND